MPLLFLPGNRIMYDAIKISYFEIIVILTLILFCLFLITNKKLFQLSINWLDILVIFYILIYYILNLANKADSNNTFKSGVELYLLAFYLLVKFNLLFLKGNNQASYIKSFIILLLSICFIECILGFLQKIQILPYDGELVYDSRVIGTFGNPNNFGSFIIVLFPFTLWLFNSVKGRILIFKYLLLFVMIVILLLTNSRGSWLGLAGGVLFLYRNIWLKYWRIINTKLIKGIIVIAIFICIAASLLALVHADKSSSNGRLFIWKVSTMMIQDNFFTGIGNSNYELYFPLYQAKLFESGNSIYDFSSNVRQSHNQYLEILTEKGIAGFILFILIITTSFYYLLKNRFVQKSKDLQYLSCILGSVLAVILIHSLFDSPLYFFTTKMLFIFILAIISAIYTIPAADITISGSENTFKKISFFSISAILLIIGTINIPQKIMYLPGYICWSKGLKYSTTYQWDKAVKSYKQAAATIKDNGKLNFDLGYVYLMSGMYKQAVEELNKAEKAFGDKNIYLFKAMAYHEMHNYTMAIDNYKILIGMFPNLLKPKLQLSKLYIEQKDIKSAEPLLVSIIESTPKIQNNAATEIKNEARKLLKTINYEKNTDY